MKTKTMMLAACVGVCALGVEALVLPHAMNNSYSRYIEAHPPIISAQKSDEAVKPGAKAKKQRKGDDGDDNKEPVS